MKKHLLNKIKDLESFRNAIIESCPGMTLKNWQYLKKLINSDLENTLIFHIERDSYIKNSCSQNKKSFLINSKDELIDFYKISDVKHLVLYNEQDLIKCQAGNSYNTLCNIINKTEKRWIDPYLSYLFEKDEVLRSFNILNQELFSFDDIHELLNKGMVKEVAKKLGYYYQVRGSVVYGNNLGQKLGYPTANVAPDNDLKIIPANGVYTALTSIDNKWYKSMINVGVRPTISNSNLTIEAHLFDFNNTVYGKNISIHFIDRLRSEKRFPKLELLKKQIMADEKKALDALKTVEGQINIKGTFCLFK